VLASISYPEIPMTNEAFDQLVIADNNAA
jgi:hypothetical protein